MWSDRSHCSESHWGRWDMRPRCQICCTLRWLSGAGFPQHVWAVKSRCHNDYVDDVSDEAPEEELDSTAKHESREDKIFQKFKSKVALEPEQVNEPSYSSFLCSFQEVFQGYNPWEEWPFVVRLACSMGPFTLMIPREICFCMWPFQWSPED